MGVLQIDFLVAVKEAQLLGPSPSIANQKCPKQRWNLKCWQKMLVLFQLKMVVHSPPVAGQSNSFGVSNVSPIDRSPGSTAAVHRAVPPGAAVKPLTR